MNASLPLSHLETPALPLRGKHLAVICDDARCERLSQLGDAARALGAKVTHIHPSQAELGDPAALLRIGALLGRLYDGLECHGLPDDVVDALGRAATRPVWAGGDCHARIGAQGLRVWLLSVLS